jgi:hypothetical protein
LDADPLTVPLERTRSWLPQLAEGEFGAPMPKPEREIWRALDENSYS